MFDSSSYDNPTPLARTNASRDVLPRALDWYQIFGSTLVQNTAMDFAQLKAALSKAFPAIQNKKELEIRFYASQQRQNQELTDFVYDLLKLHKKLELGMSEKAPVDHIFVILEPQAQDYVEVCNPQTAIQLLEVLAKFEERYSYKATLGSRNSNNVEGREKIELREDLKSRRGLAESLEIICHNCRESTSTMSSKISNKCYDFNLRLTYGMRAIGKGGAAARIFCGLMNLPPPPAKFERHNSFVFKCFKNN
ncbi:uncharacterized protein TNCV_3078231 [Trichonephila clavipes]|nr:uncharacterized protein TNCV_3078231 [Trichonephila clavipes]